MATDPDRRSELLSADGVLFTHRSTARLQDVDAAGVVFFGHAFVMFNDALLELTASAGYSTRALIEDHGLLLPVKHAAADYLEPMRLGDAIAVEIVSVRVEGAEFRAGYRVRHRPEKGGESTVALVGQTRQVCVSSRDFTRVDLPAPVLRAFGHGGT